MMLADSSMQNSFSSFGPKVPLAGKTVAEQKAAWLPMSCQTERTDIQLTLILPDFLFRSKRTITTELFSGLGHFQVATHTVCWGLHYNSPMVRKILMPTFIPNNFRCPTEASGLGAESLLSLSQSQVFPGWSQCVWYWSRILEMPHLSLLTREVVYRDNPGVGTSPKWLTAYGMNPGVQPSCSHTSIRYHVKCWGYSP